MSWSLGLVPKFWVLKSNMAGVPLLCYFLFDFGSCFLLCLVPGFNITGIQSPSPPLSCPTSWKTLSPLLAFRGFLAPSPLLSPCLVTTGTPPWLRDAKLYLKKTRLLNQCLLDKLKWRCLHIDYMFGKNTAQHKHCRPTVKDNNGRLMIWPPLHTEVF